MRRLHTLVKRYPLVSYFILSYTISWPAWILEERGLAWASFPGYFGPAIAAVIIVSITQDRTALKNLFARIFRWRVPIRVYLGATLLPTGIILSVIPVQLLIDPNVGFDLAYLVPLLPKLMLMYIGGTLLGSRVPV